ncbi:MAG: DUF2202 domain-containing protein [Burkholderiales bacterium]|nr:DUF2202 domain-containing protein [Burkholderiales bacterium]MCL4688582.1 DUF2202 domain-containing protein [Burkholderiales bacterium]
MTHRLAAALAVALALPLAASAAGRELPVMALPVAPTADEAADLAYLRGTGKLARDLFLRFSEAWGREPFATVAIAGLNDMDAVLRLLRRYRVADPVPGTPVGEFPDVELQALFTTLLQRGLAGELEALRVGGLVEEADLTDLALSMAHTMKADLRAVYGNLACGSRNHLRAFAREIRALTGQAYVAQSMSQAAVDAILAQPWERCGRGW